MAREVCGKDEFNAMYKQGVQNGFGIVDARQYYTDAYHSEMLTPVLEEMIDTPWFTVDGFPVGGYSTVNLDSVKERNAGGREASDVEFWCTDNKGNVRNIDDVYPNGWKNVFDAQGKPIAKADARAQMSQFASAASYFPHVMTAEEYTLVRNYVNGRFNMPPVKQSDYEVYLGGVEKQLRDRIPFVGKITSLSDMHLAHLSIDEYVDKMTKEAKESNLLARPKKLLDVRAWCDCGSSDNIGMEHDDSQYI